MPKRKRDGSADVDAGDAALGAQQQRIQYKLKQGTVKLGHAFKIAKGFERQKLGRRKKSAVTEKVEKDVQRIDAEIAALKTLDNAKCAQHHLYKTLSKIKAVVESPKLPAAVAKPTALSTDVAALNVHARLCNSNPVKEALPAVLADVQQALGVPVSEGGKGRKQRLRAKDYADVPIDGTGKGAGKDKARPIPRQDHVESDASHDEGDGGVPLDTDGSEDDLEQLNERLASSEDDGGSEDEIDVETLERQLASEGIRTAHPAQARKIYDHAADLSLSDNGSPTASPSPEPQKAPAPKKSSFLPSLTMGGYISGSGSDIDDDIDVAPKKNRRGQRARQQLWEKKFGTKAKHLQNQKPERNEGWDPKRGATDRSERSGERSRKPRDKPFGDRRPTAANAQPIDEAKIKHRDDSGPIHPSWEAAKKAKEAKAAPVAFQGKKITFD
ncbi:hypothetical protein LTR36_006338 [Oleoguttula mirabilis]|uniref:Bud22 domain-containing protein n=1 Tax=Oleoguttula mirabilis TaxID=1507867 RepID=A0AAV9JUL2_9PEZI|nr:hypothetical protein LTR36_006338 [Oleoguttula mirabilis]